jgi:Zn-dependent protease/CBS domain-containing protein
MGNSDQDSLVAVPVSPVRSIRGFVSVLLHELAHAAVARRSGARIHSITLMMLGGVTRMRDEVPADREAWMAFAGPLMSFVIAGLSYLFYRFAPIPPDAIVAAAAFALINLVIAVFNLLPAFPMDGGRVLRGLLIPRLGRVRATRVATTVGKWMAFAIGLFGLLSFNILLVLIAVFVYMGAVAERSQLEARDVLHGMRVLEFMTDRLGEVHADEPATIAGRELLRKNLDGARVVADPPGDSSHQHHRTIGVVTAWELAQFAAHGAPDQPVERAMHTDWPTVRPDDDAAKTLDALAMGDAPAVVVVDGTDRIIGLVTTEDIRRAVAIAGLAARPPGTTA